MNMTVIANRFWLLFLCIAATPVWASGPVPTELELHHDDGATVELLNKGGADGTANIDTNLLLFKALADAPSVHEMPLARTDWMMEQGLPVCSLNRVKSRARSAKYLFSLPVNFYLGYQLYQHSAAEPLPPSLLNNKGQVTTLKALLRRYPDNQIVVPKSYSFGDALDRAVAEIPPRQITAISTSHYYQNFVAMFKAGRADFILIYPTEMRAYLQNNPELKVRHYPLAQAPVYSTGHLMCADTVQTREFIQRVDAVLRKLYRQPDFIAANSRTLAATEALAIRRAIKTQSQH
jgi:uncharacterized protein (TIGR02285 family)